MKIRSDGPPSRLRGRQRGRGSDRSLGEGSEHSGHHLFNRAPRPTAVQELILAGEEERIATCCTGAPMPRTLALVSRCPLADYHELVLLAAGEELEEPFLNSLSQSATGSNSRPSGPDYRPSRRLRLRSEDARRSPHVAPGLRLQDRRQPENVGALGTEPERAQAAVLIWLIRKYPDTLQRLESSPGIHPTPLTSLRRGDDRRPA